MTECGHKDEIIHFVMNASDADNLIIAAFIAGMQAKRSTNLPARYASQKKNGGKTRRPQENRPA